jgi:hypothetical protein
MRTTTDRIDRRTAELLLDGVPAGPAHRPLAALLAAAAAPPRPHELAGERAAVAALRRAHTTGVDATRAHTTGVDATRAHTTGVDATRARAARDGAGHPAKPARSVRRLALVKAAAAGALALTGGVALAAETGHLPAPIQRRVHEMFSAVGVPPPDPTPAASAGPTGRPGDPRPAGPPSGVPSPPAAAELCLAWRAAEKDPRGKAMAADALRALMSAAGRENRSIPAFCADVLDPTHAPTPGPPGPPGTAGSSHGQPQSPGHGRSKGHGG